MIKRILATAFAVMLTLSVLIGTVGCTFDPSDGTHVHKWVDASCTEARHCSECEETEGEPLGHSGGAATCTARAVCTVCGAEYGEISEHNYTNGSCTVCGASDGNAGSGTEGGGTGDGTEGGGSTGGGDVTPSPDAKLVDAAWALPIGGTLGTQTLTGVITELEDYNSEFNNRTITIVVDGKTDKPIVAYRLKGEGIAELQLGDTVKITGELMNYQNSDGSGLVEFHSGCTFVLVSSDTGAGEGGTETPKTEAEIVDAAWALPIGGTLGTQTLTGVVSRLEEYNNTYGDRSLTIIVAGKADKPIYAFQLKGEGIDSLGIGDTITITGELIKYNSKDELGVVEFNKGASFVLVSKAEGTVPDDKTYTYTDFTSEEKAIFTEYFNTVIPFIPNDEYYIEDYSVEGAPFLFFYTYGNTEAEFTAYKAMFSSFTYIGEDSYEGIAWYTYEKGTLTVELSYYINVDNEKCVDVYIYTDTEGGTETPKTDAELVDAAWALPIGGTLGTQTLTGVITELEDYNSEFNNRTITIVVDGKTDKPIVAYRLKGEGIAELQLGDTVRITGELMNYQSSDGSGLVEFHSGCTFVLVSSDTGAGEGGEGGDNEGETYTDFTADEKALFNEYFGFVVPFITNGEYYVYDFTDSAGEYLYFFTYGNTEAEFTAYKALFDAAYTYAGEGTDDDGITWYYYDMGDVYIDIAYYVDTDGNTCVDVCVYVDDPTGGEGGGEGGGADEGSGTIGGANLPEGTDGIYNVDFTEAENVKNVTDQGYYIDGCPTVGSPAVLVIPVDFSDFPAAALGYDTSVISNAFKKGGVTDYYSVYDYYYASSYGQLSLDITVLDFWFRPENDSTYYKNLKGDVGGTEIDIGDQVILDEALKYLDTVKGMDLSKFDSDGNSIIDAVVLINTVNIDYDYNFNWAYRYWNYYTDSNDNYYEYDGVSANDYIWASYEFLYESYDENGNVNYDDETALNTYTYIHEFGHVLGADDYYDTTGDGSPMGGCDIMDGMHGDHNAFTKFNYGWLTGSRLVVTDTSVTLTLEDFSKAGDTIIIANNWDSTLGAYQEYYIVVYYKVSGLNGSVNGVDYGYFARDGIIVYHVNASLYSEVIDGVTYYDIANNNSTPDGEYGSEDNLIEFVLSGEGNYTYVAGDTLPSVTDDNGERLAFTFTVDSLSDNEASLTFTRVTE